MGKFMRKHAPNSEIWNESWTCRQHYRFSSLFSGIISLNCCTLCVCTCNTSIKAPVIMGSALPKAKYTRTSIIIRPYPCHHWRVGIDLEHRYFSISRSNNNGCQCFSLVSILGIFFNFCAIKGAALTVTRCTGNDWWMLPHDPVITQLMAK